MSNMKQMYSDKEKTQKAYPKVWLPIGTVYFNKNDITDEINLYFEGTWERCLQGEVLVGVNENDNDFKTSWATFGSKTHTLTIQQIPSHNHTITLPFNTAVDGYQQVTVREATAQYNKIIASSDAGGGQAHNIVQPSRMAYAWIRVS